MVEKKPVVESVGALLLGGILLGLPLGAQVKSDTTPPVDSAARAEALLRELGTADPRGRAYQRLLRLGPAAAAAVRASLAADQQLQADARLRSALSLLADLGPQAESCMPALWERVEKTSGETRRLLIECILDIAPHLGAAGAPELQRARGVLSPLMQDARDEALQKRTASSWFRAVQLGVVNSRSCHSGLEAGQLLEEMTHFKSYPYRRGMAADLFSRCADRSEAQDKLAISLILAQLDRPIERRRISTSTGATSIAYVCGPRSHRRWALALLRLSPGQDARLAAQGYLLGHGRTHERLRALEILRGHPAGLPELERTLAEIAGQEEHSMTLRNEVVTTLGMLDQLGPSTLQVLRELRSSSHRGLAARVEAALRKRGQDGRRQR